VNGLDSTGAEQRSVAGSYVMATKPRVSEKAEDLTSSGTDIFSRTVRKVI
jgi:hypothetical protein